MVTLRNWERSDAEKLSRILNNKKVLDNLRDGLPYPYTPSDALAYIEFCQNADKNSNFCCAVLYDNEVVGSIGAFRQQNIHCKTAELGYYIGEEYWGRGIAARAVQLLCDYIFENTDILRIYAEPFARNKASCRVLEKSGFICEGTLRANAVKCGIVEDMKMYALVKA